MTLWVEHLVLNIKLCTNMNKCEQHLTICNSLHDTYLKKNADYGNSFSDIFEEVGMPYAYGHLAEKLKRIKSLMANENKVKGESMRDSLLDLANYAILTIVELDSLNHE